MLSGHSQLRTQPPAELDDDQDHTSEPENEGAVVIPDIMGHSSAPNLKKFEH